MPVAATPPPFALQLAQMRLAAAPALALDNFTWINNVTTGAGHCRFAHAADHCLTRHTGLPFTAIAVEGQRPATLRSLAAALLDPGQAAYTLAPARIATPLAAAVRIRSAQLEWQMLYEGDAATLDPGPARLLTPADLPAMLALAASDEVMVFNADSLHRGHFYGLFVAGELAAMGGVQNRLPGYAEIGSIVTHPAWRRRGYASHIVAALLRHLQAEQQRIFLCLFQSNVAARRLYEKLGFTLINELTLLHWQLP